MTEPDIVLTIAGSDSSGGAGIQADLKSFMSVGVYGASVVTAVTAQNTATVHGVHVVPADMVGAQIDAVLSDLPVKAVKIGMVGSRENASVIAARLLSFDVETIIVDTPMISGTGSPLGNDRVRRALVDELLPIATVITPNLAEAGMFLSQPPAKNAGEMVAQAKALRQLDAKAVLVKGGHLGETSGELPTRAVDVLDAGEDVVFLEAEWVDVPHTHGTGCSLSAAIAAFMAKGEPLEAAVKKAKAWLTTTLKGSKHMQIGSGPGPLNHVPYAGR